MPRNQWLARPLDYISARFESAARYLGHAELVSVRRKGVPILHMLPLMKPWIQALPVETLLDIGANNGQFAVCAAEIFPKARIYSFEPLPECFAVLQERMAKMPQAQAFHMGLGSVKGELMFQRSNFNASSSFRAMAQAHREAYPESVGHTEVKVRVERLDDVAPGLDLVDPMLIKIDVQGYEDHVLRGGETTIRRAKWVIVETSFVPLYEGQPLFDDVYRWMVERGFRMHGAMSQMEHPMTGEVLQADSIFVRD